MIQPTIVEYATDQNSKQSKSHHDRHSSVPVVVTSISEDELLRRLDLSGRVEMGKRSNRGGYSDVWRGILRTDREEIEVAIKELRLQQSFTSHGKTSDQERLRKRCFREVILWSKLQHENVIPLLGYTMDSEGIPTLISPWYPNGNIVQFILAHPKSSRLSLILNAAEGLKYLHSIPVVHGDLKGENVLVDASHRASLCDFGMSQFIGEGAHITGFTTSNAYAGGTLRFLSPELLESGPDPKPEALEVDPNSKPQPSPKTTASDMWAFGCLVVQILTDQIPYEGIAQSYALLLAIMAGKRPMTNKRGKIGKELWNCLLSCWNLQPGDRPSISELCQQLYRLEGGKSTTESVVNEKTHSIALERTPRQSDRSLIQTENDNSLKPSHALDQPDPARPQLLPPQPRSSIVDPSTNPDSKLGQTTPRPPSISSSKLHARGSSLDEHREHTLVHETVPSRPSENDAIAEDGVDRLKTQVAVTQEALPPSSLALKTSRLHRAGPVSRRKTGNPIHNDKDLPPLPIEEPNAVPISGENPADVSASPTTAHNSTSNPDNDSDLLPPEEVTVTALPSSVVRSSLDAQARNRFSEREIAPNPNGQEKTSPSSPLVPTSSRISITSSHYSHSRESSVDVDITRRDSCPNQPSSHKRSSSASLYPDTDMGPSRYQRSASGRQSSDETGATIATIAPTIHNLLLHPSVLSALLKHLSFREFLPLLSFNKALKKSIQDQKEIKELVLERYLGVTVGYERWSVGRMGRRQEPIRLSLRDLNSYMRGESISLQNMRSIGQEYVSALASKAQPSSRHAKAAVPSNLKDAVRLIASSCRAYTRIVARLRAQAEAIAAYGMSPFSLSSDTTDPGSERISGRCEKAPTSLYTAGCAALLKVFVPSPEGWWLSDATVVDCRKQLERADVLGLLQVGDIVWDVAAGERRNDGRMIWDGKYWLDLDYAHSRMGEIPPSVDSLAFPLSFWDHSLIRSDDPVYYFDLSPFVVEIASNIERVESSSLTETPEGDPYFVSDWSYRTRFRIRPGMRVGSMTASSDLAGQRQQPAVVNSDWVGSVVIETESTNEGLADLQARCGNSVILAPAGHILREKDGSGWRLSNDGVVKRSPFKLLRKKSRPGNIWLQCILGKETPP